MSDRRRIAMHRTMSKGDFEALADFRYRLRQFLRVSEELTRAHGMTPLQYQLLLQVRGFQGREWATVGELAERLQAKHHGVVSLISRCETAGWVKRRRGHTDRRRVEVSLTPQGKTKLNRLARLHRIELVSLRDALAFSVPTMPRSLHARNATSEHA